MADLLDMDYINNLPQPLWDGDWPVHDIDVQTGLYRIDVCGLLEVRHIDRCITMKDATGKEHYTGDFCLDPEQWEDRWHAMQDARAARFEMVSCSSCGCGFGPGDAGFSHCDQHAHMRVVEE